MCRNQQLFVQYFPLASATLGDLVYGLSSSGDAVPLYDDYGDLVDEVAFRNNSPWPDDADGNGASLALTFPFADNAVPASWFAAFPHGTPGQANIQIAPIDVTNFTMLSTGGDLIGLRWQASRCDVGNIFHVQMLEKSQWKDVGDEQNIRLTSDNEFQFINAAVSGESTFRLEYTNSDGAQAHSETLVAEEANAVKNNQFDLFPNPFNNAAVIRFVIEKEQHVDVKVYNLRGRLVAHLAAKEFAPGAHDIVWHACAQPSGLYFCEIETPTFTQRKKLSLQK